MKYSKSEFGNSCRQKLLSGVDTLADSVKVTLGPKGRHACIDRGFGEPLITKDGVTVARSIILEDPVERMGSEIIKAVASRTNNSAGDGTTTATVLSQALFLEGCIALDQGCNPVLLKRHMDDVLNIEK